MENVFSDGEDIYVTSDPPMIRDVGVMYTRLEDTTGGSTCLGYTGLCGGLEHLKIETRLIAERFESVKGEYVI